MSESVCKQNEHEECAYLVASRFSNTDNNARVLIVSCMRAHMAAYSVCAVRHKRARALIHSNKCSAKAQQCARTITRGLGIIVTIGEFLGGNLGEGSESPKTAPNLGQKSLDSCCPKCGTESAPRNDVIQKQKEKAPNAAPKPRQKRFLLGQFRFACGAKCKMTRLTRLLGEIPLWRDGQTVSSRIEPRARPRAPRLARPSPPWDDRLRPPR